MSNSDSVEDYSSRDVVKDRVNATLFSPFRSFRGIFRSSFRAEHLPMMGRYCRISSDVKMLHLYSTVIYQRS